MLVTPRKLFYSHEKLSTQSNSIATRITFFCIFCFLHDFYQLVYPCTSTSTLILVFPNDIIPEVSWFVLIKRWTP